MTYKEKLIELLKTDDEVKNVMEKLEFWTQIKFDYERWRVLSVSDSWKITFLDLWNYICYSDDNEPYDHKPVIEIIWLPLQDRFIRMYCENINKCEKCWNNLLIIDGTCKWCTGNNAIDKCSCWLYLECSDECWDKHWWSDKKIDNLKNYCELMDILVEEEILDNKKDFDQQDDKVYKQIFNYLKYAR